MSKEEKKIPLYNLLILRKDQFHIEVMETDNYDKIFEKYKEVKDQWAKCIKDQNPFELTSPVVTTFDPGLIYEITIKLVTETPSSRYENPYNKQMQEKGFSKMFSSSSDLLDNGYR